MKSRLESQHKHGNSADNERMNLRNDQRKSNYKQNANTYGTDGHVDDERRPLVARGGQFGQEGDDVRLALVEQLEAAPRFVDALQVATVPQVRVQSEKWINGALESDRDHLKQVHSVNEIRARHMKTSLFRVQQNQNISVSTWRFLMSWNEIKGTDKKNRKTTSPPGIRPLAHLVFPSFSLGLTRLDLSFHTFTGFQPIFFLRFSELKWFLLSFTGFYLVFLVLLPFTGFSWVFTGFY